MKKFLVLMTLTLSIFALLAQTGVAIKPGDSGLSDELLELIASKQSRDASFSFVFLGGQPHNLPDIDDLADPDTGEFLEDIPWTKDFTRHINNPEGLNLTLSLLNPAMKFTITQPESGNPYKWHFEPIEEHWNGSEVLVLVLEDEASGVQAMTLVRINVTPVPDPPIWINLPDGNLFSTLEEEDLIVEFKDYVQCLDSLEDPSNFDLSVIANDEYPITVIQDPPNDGSLVTFSPHLNFFGLVSYDVTAKDRASNAFSTQTIWIEVINVNDPPEITQWHPLELEQTVDQSESLSFWVTAVDVDDDPLTYTWTHSGFVDGEPFTQIVSTEASLDLQFDIPGVQTVTCVVDDGEDQVSMSWTVTVSPHGPIFAPVGGIYTSGVNVALSVPAGFENAVIHYTLDGNTPDESSDVYTGPIEVPALVNAENIVNIKAIFFAPGFPSSQVESATYRITGTVAAPVFNPGGGIFVTPQEVGLSSSTPSAQIYYTTNGEEPVPGAAGTQLYENTIQIPGESSVTLKAKATREDWLDSETVTHFYQVTGTVQIVSHEMDPMPVSEGFELEHGESLEVEIQNLSLLPSAAVLYYTLDGTAPAPANPSAQIYTAGQKLELTQSSQIRLQAHLEDWQSSQEHSYQYIIRTRTVFLPFANGTVFDPQPGYSTVPMSVSLSENTSPTGANIYYSTDGNHPTLLYTGPIWLEESATVKAFAQYPGFEPSAVFSGDFVITGTVAAPVFDPAPGSYSTQIDLEMSSATESAEIWYSEDGSEPIQGAAGSILYTGPFALEMGLHTIKARAFKDHWDPSPITEGVYSISVLPAPVFDHEAGIYQDPITVRLSVPGAPEAQIHYTDDGSEPDEFSILYDFVNGIQIGLETSKTIKAIATQTGWQSSSVAERHYEVTGTVATPTFNPDGGTHSVSVTVAINTTTSGAQIRYTTDGSDPSSTHGEIYTGSIQITSSSTLKAMAHKENWRDSQVYEKIYTIIGNIADPVFTPGAGTFTTPIDVYISVNPPDASIYYTNDASEPSPDNGTLYVNGTPIHINGDVLLRARAYKSGWNVSGISDAQYYITGTVAAPQFDPPSGQYATAQNVALSTIPEAAEIRYTLDGTTPTRTHGMVYGGPIEVASNKTIRAMAWLNGWDDSPVSSASYVINGPVAKPVISPASGYFTSPQTVNISVIPAAANVYYTLDGTDPVPGSSQLYTVPFVVQGHTVVKAIARLENWLDSPVAMVEYQFVVANPSITPPAGSYASTQTVSINTITDGASIRYTTDNSTPSPEHGILYEGSFNVESTTTVKAIAFRDQWISSSVVSHSYVINGPVADPLFSVSGGNYSDPFNVTISTLPAGSAIYYTLDETEPSETNGTLYSGPIHVEQNTVLKARAYRTNWLPSNVSTVSYNFHVKPVSIVPNGGTYTSAQLVTLNTATPGALINYTLNGVDPVPGTGLVYDPANPVLVDENLTLKAVASLENWHPSPVSTASFQINIPLPVVAAPVIQPGSGVYNTAQTVTITSTTPDATLVYTSNGEEPTLDNGIVYTGSFVVSSNTVLKARGYKDGHEPSSVTTVQYVIVIPIETVATPEISPASGIYTEPIQISITTQTPEATIRYTTDGMEPSTTVGEIYTGSINISETTTVKAIAYKTGMNPSLISNASYVINIAVPEVAAPMFSHPTGTYFEPISVSISTTTENTMIRYTTDGSTPSATSGILYEQPIEVGADSSLFIQAIAYRDGWNPSPVVSANYNVTGTVADVVFNPVGGVYTQATSVALSNSTPGAAIHYTINGDEPTQGSSLYTTPIIVALNSSVTIRARAFKSGWQPSQINQESYTVTGQVVIPAPVFSVPAGTYASAQTVSLNSPVPSDAVIRYTTNGEDPTELSDVYGPPIQLPLNSNITLKARAFKENWLPSPVYTANYVMTGQVILSENTFDPPAGIYQTPQTITLVPATLPTAATLRYTINGTEPSQLSPAYVNPIPVGAGTTVIKVKGFMNDWTPSETVSASYTVTGQVAFNTPVFTPAPGVYATAQQITVNTAIPGDAVVRYTTDGSDPTELSAVYGSPIALPLDSALTLKVRAFKPDWAPSEIHTGNYTTTGAVTITLPVFDPSPGTYTTPQSVSINTVTIPANATLRYTVDGSDPNESSPIYQNPIQIANGQTVTIRVRAYAPNWQPSAIHSGTFTVTGQVSIAQPVFTPPAGTYQTAQVVTLNTQTTPAGATLRYTTNGDEPTASSPVYSSGITLGLGTVTTIKVKAFLNNWQPSETYSATYTITGALSIVEPVFTPAAGTYQTAQSVLINTTTLPAGATVRYTTNGSDPTATSRIYENPIQIGLNSSMTIKARAFLSGWTPSQVYTANYTVTGQVQLPAQVFSPTGGTYYSPQTVTISTNTIPAAATLRYTTNGTEPSQLSPAYVNPIPVGAGTTVIKVKGFMNDWTPSETVSATYTVTGQVAFNTPVFTPAPGVYATAQQITVNTAIPADAVIRYTTNGADPTEASTIYSGPIALPLDSALTLKVRAFKPDWAPSEIHTGNYTTTGAVTITLPVFNPSPGTYTTPQSVSINTVTIPANATLRYTVDGSDPNESSPIYQNPIQIANGQTVTIRVRAYAPNWQPSAIHSGTFTVTGQVSIAQPVFTPPAGTYQTAQVVTLNTQTTPAGATLRYTTNGDEPTASSPVYSSGITLGLGTVTTIKVKAFLNNWQPSETYSATYTITGALSIVEPVFTPAAGTYQTAQSVVINTTTLPAGATVRYTTNGSDPTATSPIYENPIQIGLNSSMTIKARAFLSGWTPSQVYTANYTVTGQVQLPTQVFSPAGGTYQTAQTVTLNTATSPTGATLRYTTDGTVPTENSAAYTAPINLPLNSSTTIRVKAFKADWTPSEAASAMYVITGQVAFNTPVFTPTAGTYQTAQNVVIAGTIPSDATIRYTTDNSEPTASSPIYTAPINLPLNSSTTIKVKAFKADWTASATHSASYTITGQASIATPVFSPEPGTYNAPQQVSLNSSTLPTNAVIRFTTDGSDPTASSSIYQSPFQIDLNSNVTIKARAFAQDWTPSQVYAGNYIVTGTVSITEPVFSPAAGTYTSNIQVVLNTQTNPAGAILRYTLDGSEPNESDPAYIQPIHLLAPGDFTVKVKAFKSDWLPSQTYTAQYSLTGQMQLVQPYLDPAPGVYTEPISVVASGGTEPSGGTIRYTIDGSVPTQSSPVFGSPIEIGLNTVAFKLSIRAFKDGWTPSVPYTGTYNVTGQVELPEILFSPAAGTYQTAQSVSFADPILPANATIRYTLDGSEPTAFSAAYVTPIQLPLNSVTTLKAKGFAEGWIPSATKTAVYTVTGTLSPPVFSPGGGTFGTPVQVVISALGEDVSIHYTTDGSEPTQDSPEYTQPITVPNYAQNMVISARAFKDGWTPSTVASATYTVLSAPMNIRGINYAGFIRVLWNMPGSVRALRGFNVYRRTLDQTNFTKLNTLPVNDLLDGNYYYDDYSISMDVSYEYYVTAVYDEEESPPSSYTLQQYQTQDLAISDASYAWPNPATDSAEIVVVLNRNKDVTLTVSIFDFAGKKVRTLTTPPQDSNRIRIPWDLKNSNGSKVGRGTYFARVVANDGVNKSEYVIKIAVK